MNTASDAVAGHDHLLEQVLDNSGLLVAIKDAELRFVRVSRPLLAMFAPYCISPLGKRLADVLPAQIGAAVEARDRQALAGGVSAQLEETLELDGVRRTLLSTRIPLMDALGRPGGLCTISTEITARKRIETALQTAGLGLAGLSGRRLHQRLAQDVALTLGVDLAFIAAVDGPALHSVTTLGLCYRHQILDNLQYPLLGTPCRTVISRGFQFIPEGLGVAFPEDESLLALGVQSYAGYPLFDSSGDVLGLIVAAHSKPMQDPEGTAAVLRIYAMRAAAECERERAEYVGMLSERSYQEIFNASEDAIFVHDVNTGAIVDVNPRACTMYGYTREELCGMPVSEISSGVPPYTQEEAQRQLTRAAQGETARFEWHRRSRDGSLHWDEVVLKRAELAGVPRILAFIREVSERKAAEEALRASEERYRTIFDASVDGLALWNREGRIVEANRAFCGMHGYSRNELLRLDPRAFVHPDSWRKLEQFLEFLQAGHPFQTEALDMRSDGSAFPVEVSGVPIDYGGAPHMLSIVRDITERQERERALRRSEDRLRATVEASLDCIVCMDTEGRIIEFNPAAEACFGYHRAQVIGSRLADRLIPPASRQAHQGGLQRYRETGVGPYLGRRVEVSAMRADGSEFPAELTIAVTHGPEGEIFVGSLRDITAVRKAEAERQVLESRLRQAQKMEALGHLTGGIAHDFNNILTSILGYAVLARENAAALTDSHVLDYLAQIQRSGEHARDLIRQMLTFSRGERGEPQPLLLPGLVAEAVRLYRSSFPATVVFELRQDNNAPPVLADPILLEQALMNLCINARDAMDGTGTITIRVDHRVDLDAECASCGQSVCGAWVSLSVTDTGPGIPPGIQDRIFDPFFSTKEVGQGSGMGLATIHGVIHEYGGHVLLETGPGGGTCMHLLLPVSTGSVVDKKVEPAPASRTGPAGPRTGHILVVDDQASVRAFMAELLGTRGFRVSLAASAEEALGQLALRSVDLVISDQSMPEVTGLALAETLHARYPQLPVLLYSGHPDTLPARRITGTAIHAVLTKPIEVDALMAAIGTALAAERGSHSTQ
ncbi:PAS domain S-box protein [Aquisalimonas sp.]|uniref:hybrid sensor histidine kinase/response regulator n=1 Tax=Aquisalimonas sp. TaxID=1872621 RepID=UPI0025C4C9D2|nr:PAS domain S-box protein [Aquisalimonas sp.]